VPVNRVVTGLDSDTAQEKGECGPPGALRMARAIAYGQAFSFTALSALGLWVTALVVFTEPGHTCGDFCGINGFVRTAAVVASLLSVCVAAPLALGFVLGARALRTEPRSGWATLTAVEVVTGFASAAAAWFLWQDQGQPVVWRSVVGGLPEVIVLACLSLPASRRYCSIRWPTVRRTS
jgi:hypothetical protein